MTKPPKVFRVNWFRTDARGKFIWPGFRENLRVVKWIFERCDGVGKGKETPIGIVPTPDAIDQTGLTISKEAMETLVAVEPGDWAEASADQADVLQVPRPASPARDVRGAEAPRGCAWRRSVSNSDESRK